MRDNAEQAYTKWAAAWTGTELTELEKTIWIVAYHAGQIDTLRGIEKELEGPDLSVDWPEVIDRRVQG